MFDVHLIKPGNAYTTQDSSSGSAAVSGGGFNYLPEEYVTNGSFEGSSGSWVWWKAGASVSAPANVVEVDYSDAAIGDACGSATFSDATEFLVIDIYNATEKLALINTKQIVFEFWAKTSDSGFTAYMEGDGTISNTGDALVSIGTSTTWVKYSMQRTYTFGGSNKYFVIGFKKTSGTGSIKIDGIRLYAPANLTDAILNTYIEMSPSLIRSAPTEIIGDTLVFTSGNNARYGSTIESIVNSGTAISRITISDGMPFAPVLGDKFVILTEQYRHATISQMATVTRYLESATVSSSAEDGYTRGTFKLARNAIGSRLRATSLVGWTVSVTSPWGMVWEGYVVNCAVADESFTLDCVGFKTKLDKVFYVGYFNSDASNTTTVALRDIMTASPELDTQSIYGIDRDGSINAAQILAGGIGPLDFTKTPVTAQSAIADVLKIGAYGDDTFDILVAQVFDHQTLQTGRIKYEYDFTQVNWFIPEENVMKSGGGSEFSIDRSEFANVHFGTFRGPNGETLETPGVYAINDVIEFGIAEQTLTTGNLTDGEVGIILEARALERLTTSSISNIEIYGKVRKLGQGNCIPCFMIRGGDTLFVPGITKMSRVTSGDDSIFQIFVAGEVECDLMDGTVRVTPYGFPEKTEMVVNQLDIDTGG
jgi:hypothetical protein